MFLHRKTDRKARLKESLARRFLGTFERSKVPGENVLFAYISDITLERGQNHKITRSVCFGVQGCVCTGKEPVTATVHNQRLRTNPFVALIRRAVSLKLFPSPNGFVTRKTLAWEIYSFAKLICPVQKYRGHYSVTGVMLLITQTQTV